QLATAQRTARRDGEVGGLFLTIEGAVQHGDHLTHRPGRATRRKNGPSSRAARGPALVAPELHRRELSLERLGGVDDSVRLQLPDEVPDPVVPPGPEPALLVHRVVLDRIGNDGGEERRLLDAEVAGADAEVVPGRLAQAVDAGAPLDDV